MSLLRRYAKQCPYGRRMWIGCYKCWYVRHMIGIYYLSYFTQTRLHSYILHVESLSRSLPRTLPHTLLSPSCTLSVHLTQTLSHTFSPIPPTLSQSITDQFSQSAAHFEALRALKDPDHKVFIHFFISSFFAKCLCLLCVTSAPSFSQLLFLHTLPLFNPSLLTPFLLPSFPHTR